MKRGILILIVVVGVILLGVMLGNKIISETKVPVEIPNPIVTMTVSGGEQIVIELYPQIALNTVANFIELINKGFYDGLYFFRVVPGFMIMAGDPTNSGLGGPGYTIKGEFESNGVTNDLKHTRGTISMARTSDKNSAGSQFFIMHADDDGLDGDYAAFGKVISGMEVVDYIANVAADANDKPLVMSDCKIEKMTVDTFGYKYSVVKYDK